MIEEVKDLIDDVRDKVGDKGFFVIVIVLVAVGAYLLSKSFTSSGTTTDYAPIGVASYPDVGANADEVMESVNNAIDGAFTDLSGIMDSRFEYVESILGELDNEISVGKEEIINTSNQNTQSVIQNSNSNTATIVQTSNENKQAVTEAVKEVEQVAQKVTTSENTTQSYTPPKVTTTTTKQNTTPKGNAGGGGTSTPKSSGGGSANKAPSTYTYTTKSGLNTSQSIVDALKASGADSSFQARAKIYYANGGTGTYTGSASQNTALLNKMKSGNLVKA